VDASPGPTIEVHAERVIHATSDGSAAAAVSHVRITEDVSPDRIVLRSEGLAGILVGVEIEVNFHITVPPATRLRLHGENGDITVANVAGSVVASSTNGAITARALSGGIEARSTNGALTVDLAAVGPDPVDLRVVNGDITLSLPASAAANIDATCTNGSLDVSALALEAMGEQSTRRMRGRLNGGGVPVALATTNGNVTVRPRP